MLAYRESRTATDQPIPAVISEALRESERIVWWGRPHGGFQFTKRDLHLVPRAVMAVAGAVGAMLFARRTHSLFSIVVSAGLLLAACRTVGWYATDRWRRARTWYVVTSHRALIITATRRERHTKSVDLGSEQVVETTETPAGRGWIRFGPPQEDSGWLPAVPISTFENIARVRDVAALVHDVQQSLRGGKEVLPR